MFVSISYGCANLTLVLLLPHPLPPTHIYTPSPFSCCPPCSVSLSHDANSWGRTHTKQPPTKSETKKILGVKRRHPPQLPMIRAHARIRMHTHIHIRMHPRTHNHARQHTCITRTLNTHTHITHTYTRQALQAFCELVLRLPCIYTSKYDIFVLCVLIHIYYIWTYHIFTTYYGVNMRVSCV